MTIWDIDNGLQITVLLICAFITLYRGIRLRSREWTLLGLFFACWALDDIYWLVYYRFYDTTPLLNLTGSLSWYAAKIFLYMLIRQIAPPEGERRRLPLLGSVFALAMSVFYSVMWGSVISNLIIALLMGLLLYASIRRLQGTQSPQVRSLCIITLVYCILEYGLWTASCFPDYVSLASPYYWFDFLLTASFPFFMLATRKAVAV